MSGVVPPGWPPELPPPASPGWEARAAQWLLDLCPPEYRGYPVLRRQPVVLAWLAVHHVDAQLEGSARATARARGDLGGSTPVRVVEEVLDVLDREHARLLAAARAARLVLDALRGHRHVPRL